MAEQWLQKQCLSLSNLFYVVHVRISTLVIMLPKRDAERYASPARVLRTSGASACSALPLLRRSDIAMNRTTMSSTSAIQLVAQWIEVHGRRPLRDECRKENGLPHYITLFYVCGGVTKAVQLAQAYLAVSSTILSSVPSTGNGISACPCSTRMTTCLRCGRVIVWEGRHVRQCPSCRKRRGEEEGYVVMRWRGHESQWPWEEQMYDAAGSEE